MQAQLSLGIGADQKVDVRDLIVHGEIERKADAARREPPSPEWERVLEDGADCAFRRRCGGSSQLLVLLATQGQAYVLNERSGSRHQLTAARLATFCKGAGGDALTPPWCAGPLQDLDARGRAAVVSLMGCDDFLQMARRDMVRAEPAALSRTGAGATRDVLGSWGDASLVWRLVEPAAGHEACRDALGAALHLSFLRSDGRGEACAECFRDRRLVARLAGALGRDVTRDLLRGFLDKSEGNPRGGTSDFIPWVASAMRAFAAHGVAADPRRVCDHALSLLDLPAVRGRSRSENVRQWAEALELQAAVRGGIGDRYPRNPAALVSRLECEREARRHEASDAAVARRAEELSLRAFEGDGLLIRPAASVREIVEEGNAQHSCVATFIDAYARGDTDLWLVRDASDPERPLVTVEVRDGALRQAFQSHNRQVTPEQWRFIAAWCVKQGYQVRRARGMRPMGA